MSAMLSIRDVSELLQVSEPTVRKLSKTDPRFPAPYKVGKVLRWDADTITKYLEQTKEQR